MPHPYRSPLRGDLIPALLTHLPATDALLIGAMDPDDYLTHVETYACLRRTDAQVPPDLLHDFVSGIVGYLERPSTMV
jgi:hypothetical protein